jgi:hypothetical protein
VAVKNELPRYVQNEFSAPEDVESSLAVISNQLSTHVHKSEVSPAAAQPPRPAPADRQTAERTCICGRRYAAHLDACPEVGCHFPAEFL